MPSKSPQPPGAQSSTTPQPHLLRMGQLLCTPPLPSVAASLHGKVATKLLRGFVTAAVAAAVIVAHSHARAHARTYPRKRTRKHARMLAHALTHARAHARTHARRWTHRCYVGSAALGDPNDPKDSTGCVDTNSNKLGELVACLSAQHYLITPQHCMHAAWAHAPQGRRISLCTLRAVSNTIRRRIARLKFGYSDHQLSVAPQWVGGWVAGWVGGWLLTYER